MSKTKTNSNFDPIESKRKKKPKYNPKSDPLRKNKKAFFNMVKQYD